MHWELGAIYAICPLSPLGPVRAICPLSPLGPVGPRGGFRERARLGPGAAVRRDIRSANRPRGVGAVHMPSHPRDLITT
jgi:hypothetical protein